MKRLAISAAIIASLLAMSAQAAPPAPANFTVNINLTSACSISTAPGTVQFTYTSFGAAANLDTNGSVGVTCTKSLVYGLALDGTGSYTDPTTGLAYTMGVAAPAAGNGLEQTYAITGTMGAGQAGTCTGATCTSSNTRTLTVSY